MPRLGGMLLLTAAVTVVTYGYLFPASDYTEDVDEVIRISAAPDRSLASANGNDASSSRSSAFREVIHEEAAGARAPSAAKPQTWSRVVPSDQAVASPLRSADPGDAETRAELASDLQRELRRVGCYDGEITGTWNAASRRAMAAFMDRANATLPFDNPDYVLLALVQSHQDVACSAECPSGQISDAGRCVPRAVAAQARKKLKRLEERRLAAAELTETHVPGNAPPPVTAEPERLPWLQTERAAEFPAVDLPMVARAEPPPRPLPGRMSVGAPIPEPPAAPPADTSSQWKPIVIVPGRGDGREAIPPSAVAARDRNGGWDDLSLNANADPLLPADGGQANVAKRKSRHVYSDRRPSRKYAARSGRRGDPRRGSARYNLMLSLGGIY